MIRETKNSKPIVYACSGCSDVGEIADRIARRLTREGDCPVNDDSLAHGVEAARRKLASVGAENAA